MSEAVLERFSEESQVELDFELVKRVKQREEQC